MNRRLIAVLAAAALTLVAALAAVGPVSAATVRHIEGRVLSVDRDARSFRLRDSERGVVRIKVTRSTRFERISGISGLRRGLTGVEATVRRSNGAWVATLVERSGGGGNHGGGNDDAAGDDHGSGGHGRDD
jgi:hypothetical protein